MADPGEMCPLSGDLIKNCKLSSVYNLHWIPGKPEFNTLELSCGHRFSNIALAYAFLNRGSSRCPYPTCKKRHTKVLEAIPAHVFDVLYPLTQKCLDIKTSC